MYGRSVSDVCDEFFLNNKYSTTVNGIEIIVMAKDMHSIFVNGRRVMHKKKKFTFWGIGKLVKQCKKKLLNPK